MKLLIFGGNQNDYFNYQNATFAALSQSNPYGFDTILVDPYSAHALYGTNQADQPWTKWREWLAKWLTSNHRIIVLLRPYEAMGAHNNYDWMPLDGFNAEDLQSSGGGDFIGDVISKDSQVKAYLESEDIDFNVQVHYKYTAKDEHVTINSQIDDDTATSFTWHINGSQAIFVPVTSLARLKPLLDSYDAAATRWKISKALELERSVSELSSQIDQLSSDREAMQIKLHDLNTNISNLIDSDTYLGQAVRALNQVVDKESPNPVNYYAVIEAIEKSFGNEVDMRDQLGFSKREIGKVTSRTNDFRHIAKTGQDPVPLTPEEITVFNDLTTRLITAYINHLYDAGKQA